ncbi:MAG: hypothetical protein ACOYUB_04095 [Patescibacteria group bacterium]
MTEGNPKEIAQKRFMDIRATVDKALFGGSRVLPMGTTNIRDILLNHTFLVSDEDYVREAQKYHESLHQPAEVVQMAVEHALKASGTYFPPYDGPTGKIFIKESYVGDEANNDDRVYSVVLEELAHSYYKSGQVPFTSIPDGSRKLMPFKTKQQYVETINRYRKNHGGLPGAEISNLTVRNSGFAHTVWDAGLVPGAGPVPYPVYQSQSMYEEYRALIVKTFLLGKVKGYKIKPYGSVQEQLTEGLDAITELQDDGEFAQIITADALITHAFDAQHFNKEAMMKLIAILHDDVDRFFEFLDKRGKENEVFFASVQQINKFMNERFFPDGLPEN